ncbi:MAG: hypothetical protein D6797_06030 [Bdellovibrio sp.]|nr:MAG: hypothetical protein D6797_06030 [Bdellovibrio sp.]
MERFQGDFLTQPRLAALINEWLPHSQAPLWYSEFLENFVVPDPNWRFVAYLITYSEWLLGLSLLLGFLVRPIGLWGAFLSYAMINAAGQMSSVSSLEPVLLITLVWLGAGRCLGFDYFFFKRQRGLWW